MIGTDGEKKGPPSGHVTGVKASGGAVNADLGCVCGPEECRYPGDNVVPGGLAQRERC